MKRYKVIYRSKHAVLKYCDETHYHAIKFPCQRCGNELLMISQDKVEDKGKLDNFYKEKFGKDYQFRLLRTESTTCDICKTVNKLEDYGCPNNLKIVKEFKDIKDDDEGFFVIEPKLDLVGIFFNTK